MKGKISHVDEIGNRDYQEDRMVIVRFNKRNWSGCLLAVLDGHGDSCILTEHCCKIIEENCSLRNFNISEAELFLDELFRQLAEETKGYVSGTTLSATLVIEKPDRFSRVSVAVLGDSPVVVYDRKRNLAFSPEHNVRSNAEEAQMILTLGGKIKDGYIYDPQAEDFYSLQLTRALGDVFLDRLLSRQPEIYTIHHPRWILVASDGLFDPSHRKSNDLITKKIMEFAKGSAEASDLVNWAMEKNLAELDDNTTAVVWRTGE
jgi:serine/threonine protein phosphatase PrpC